MSHDSRPTVFLLAQNRLLREVLSRILSKKNDLQVVGSCALSPDSFAQILSASPEILVIDSFSTTLANTELIREVQQSLPTIKLVMIGMERDERQFLETVRRGAMGYIVKDASALEVVAAVRTVAGGGAACSAELTAFLFRFAAGQNQLPNFHVRSRLGLTIREQQLVGFISRGLTNKEIAAELQLAEHTVRNHIHRMLRKLGATHRLALVDICRMEGATV
ncbi:MAG: response regulator transcription factor [Acidobacteria bacterium]|nr:response regulator transcription factor [Acidobacteriota bacterium]MBV9625907.1 response regulator transcription factor [Acidobacteriota bacterium]